MPIIKSHQRAGNEANARTVIEANPSGSYDYCHHYVVRGDDGVIAEVNFQDGLPAEVGVNGVTFEIMLAILTDRLERFQKGPHACRENALALTKLQEAQHWLAHRTAERTARGVEGTHER